MVIKKFEKLGEKAIKTRFARRAIKEITQNKLFRLVRKEMDKIIAKKIMEEVKRELKGEIYPENFESGRFFSPNLEIRWRKKGENKFYALIISDRDEFLEGYERKDLTTMKSRLSFYLWGEKSRDTWYELRIPKGWKYPVEGRYAKIKVIEYEVERNPKEGKFYRFCGFEGVDSHSILLV